MQSLVQYLSVVIGGNTTHIVVDSRKDRNRLLRDIHTGEDLRSLRDTRKTLGKKLGRKMVQVQVNVVLVRSAATTFTNFDSHRTGNHITGCQILCGRGVSLHETLSVCVFEVSPFTARPLGDQATSTEDTSRVELHELKILQGKSSTRDHSATVSSASVSRGSREVSASVTTGGKNGLVSTKFVDGSVLHIHGDDTVALTIVHHQVECEVLDEKLGIVLQGLTVKGVKHGVSGTISGTGTSVSLSPRSKFEGLASESALVDLAVVSTREREAVRFELKDSLGRFTAHVVNRVLVSKPIRTLHSVVGVPSPVILCHISKGGVDTTLGGNGV